jgi:Tol biopolymer transport system component
MEPHHAQPLDHRRLRGHRRRGPHPLIVNAGMTRPARHIAALLCLAWAVCGCGRSSSSPSPAPSDEGSGAEKRQDPSPADGELGADERGQIPGVIAFVSERGQNRDVWLVRPTGEETQLTRGPEDEFPAAPSPRGDALLVVASQEHEGVHREQLRIVPLAGGEPVALNAPRGRARNPSWARDGAWIVAESDERGFSDLVRMAPGAEPVWLTSDPQGSFEPDVSPEGKHIAFVSSRDGDPEIYVMDAGDPGSARRLTAFHKEDGAPRWSPDGRWIAFVSNREGRDRVYLIRPDGTGTRALSGTADTGEEREPAWSPDGRALAFVGRQAEGKTRIWVAPVESGQPVALTDGANRDDQPVWSPDGKYLVFVSERGGDTDLYLMRADGSAKTRLTRAPGADWLPRWFVRE